MLIYQGGVSRLFSHQWGILALAEGAAARRDYTQRGGNEGGKRWGGVVTPLGRPGKIVSGYYPPKILLILVNYW